MMKKLALPLFAITCAACATYYEGVPEGQPAAELVMIGAKDLSMMSGKMQTYYPVPDGKLKCSGSEPDRLALLNSSDARVTKRIPVNAKYFVRVQHDGFVGGVNAMGQGTLTQNYCFNTVSFTPLEGRTYSAKQETVANGCVLTILDEDTGKAPEDLKEETFECPSVG